MIKQGIVTMLAMMIGHQAMGLDCQVNGKWYDYTAPECADKPASALRNRPREVKADAQVRRSWDQERPEALRRCQNRYPDNFTMQNGCLTNEERGFNSWSGDFGMPPDVAAKAKARCEQRQSTWFLRQGCMVNESNSYAKLYK